MDSVSDSSAIAVLSEPTRVRILQIMRDADNGRVLVGRLADELALRQPTVSHHMRTLLAEGIVTREQDGRRAWYAIAPEAAYRVDAILGGPTSERPANLDRITDDLIARFAGRVDDRHVREVVVDSHSRLVAEGGRLITSRTAVFAASRLEAMSAIPGPAIPSRSVLFVCVQNAGRSQLAAGILRHLAGGAVTVRTAGSAPTRDMRSSIIVALDEIGVSVGDEFPKPLTDDAVLASDVIVTMGCGDACPVFPGRVYLDWSLDDPVGRPLAEVRRIRDDIDTRVRELLADLLPASG